MVNKVAQRHRFRTVVVAKSYRSPVSHAVVALPPKAHGHRTAEVTVGELIIAVAIQQDHGSAAWDTWCTLKFKAVVSSVPASDSRDPLSEGQVHQLLVLHDVVPEQTSTVQPRARPTHIRLNLGCRQHAVVHPEVGQLPVKVPVRKSGAGTKIECLPVNVVQVSSDARGSLPSSVSHDLGKVVWYFQ